MSAQNRSTFSGGSPNYRPSLLRSGHRRSQDVNVIDSPVDGSVERARLKKEVEYLRRRDRERKVEIDRLLSRIRSEQLKLSVVEKDVEIECRRATVWERKYELLEAEVALDKSVRESKVLREREFRQRSM